MFNSQDHNTGAAAGSAAVARARSGAEDVPRVVTTGRKNGEAKHPDARAEILEDTGERIELRADGRHTKMIRHPEPHHDAPAYVAIIDALQFTVQPPEGESIFWLIDQMRQFLPIDDIENLKGWSGFKASAVFGEGAGRFAWGGDSQRGRVLFSLMGKGCGLITDFPALAAWLEAHNAKITRLDLAYDDFFGQTINLDWAVLKYKANGFNAGGRQPQHRCFGPWLGDTAGEGRTLYIGSKLNGKEACIYEKGKQLGDPFSSWVRLEVRWKGEDRVIPYDALRAPGQYLAGAYPCLHFLSEQQNRIKTIAKAAKVSFDKAVENLKNAGGKTINLMMQVYGGEYAQVVNKLIREGLPARIKPYSYQVKRTPEMLDGDGLPAFA